MRKTFFLLLIILTVAAAAVFWFVRPEPGGPHRTLAGDFPAAEAIGTQKTVRRFMDAAGRGDMRAMRGFFGKGDMPRVRAIADLLGRLTDLRHQKSSFLDGTDSYSSGYTNVIIGPGGIKHLHPDGSERHYKYLNVMLSADPDWPGWGYTKGAIHYLESYTAMAGDAPVEVTFQMELDRDAPGRPLRMKEIHIQGLIAPMEQFIAGYEEMFKTSRVLEEVKKRGTDGGE